VPVFSALLGLAIGLMTVVVAMRMRRDLAARLGRDWRLRFLAVQGGLINVTLFVVWRYIAQNLGMEGRDLWIASIVYGPVFFFYSLSNIDWTARKFHGVDV
jgi:hypothetical protein